MKIDIRTTGFWPHYWIDAGDGRSVVIELILDTDWARATADSHADIDGAATSRYPDDTIGAGPTPRVGIGNRVGTE